MRHKRLKIRLYPSLRLPQGRAASRLPTARKYVKNFDMLSRERRGKVIEAIISGEQHGIDSDTLNSVANLVAIRNLGISFADVGQDGIYTTINGNRVAVINPKSNIIRKTIIHELTHDMEGSVGYSILSRLANSSISKEKRAELTEQYKKYYKENGLTITDEIIESEITAHFLADHLDNSNFLRKYKTEQNTPLYLKIKRWLAALANRARRNEAAQLNRAVKQIEAVYDAVIRAPIVDQSEFLPKSAIAYDKEYGNIAYIDKSAITVKEGQSYADAVKEYFDVNLKGLDVEVVSTGQTVGIRQSKKYFYRKSADMGQKRKAVEILDDIISIGENHKHKSNLVEADGIIKKHLGLSAERGWDYYDTKFLINNDVYSARVVIRKSGDGSDYFYDLDRIKKEATRSVQELNPELVSIATSSTTIIRNNSEKSTPETKKRCEIFAYNGTGS